MGGICFDFVSIVMLFVGFFFFSSRRRHTRFDCDWSSDVCSSDLDQLGLGSQLCRDQCLGDQMLALEGLVPACDHAQADLPPVEASMRIPVAEDPRSEERRVG